LTRLNLINQKLLKKIAPLSKHIKFAAECYRAQTQTSCPIKGKVSTVSIHFSLGTIGKLFYNGTRQAIVLVPEHTIEQRKKPIVVALLTTQVNEMASHMQLSRTQASLCKKTAMRT
jgi:hypothetical protein